MLRRVAAGLALLLGAPVAAADDAAPKRHVVVAAAQVHAGDGRVLSPGEILVEDGVIREIGERVKAPESAERRDLGSAIVTPVLVDPLVLVPAARGETGRLEAALLSAADGRPVHDPFLGDLRTRGIGVLGLVPSGGAGILGRAAASSTRAAPESGAPLLRDATSLVFSIPEDIPGSAARAAARASLAQVLEDAETARRKQQEKEKDAPARKGRSVSRNRPGGPSPAGSVAKDPPQPARDVILQVVDKKLPLLVALSRAEDALAVLGLARQRGIPVILAGCRGCSEVAPEIGRSQALVVLDPLHEPSFERNDLPPDPDLASALLAEGARIAVTGGGGFPEGPLALRAAAGWLRAAGATEAEAIAAMTGRAAEAAGIENQVLLRAGHPARFVEWSGSPLDPAARVLKAHEPADFEKPPEPAP